MDNPLAQPFLFFKYTWSKFSSVVGTLWKGVTGVGSLSADHLYLGSSWTIKTVNGKTCMLTRKGPELRGSCRIPMP